MQDKAFHGILAFEDSYLLKKKLPRELLLEAATSYFDKGAPWPPISRIDPTLRPKSDLPL